MVATTAFLNLDDDHRLFFSPAGPVTVNPLTLERLPYDPSHLVPLSSAALDYIVVVGTPDLPAADPRDAVMLARQRPGALAWAAAPGAIAIAFEAFAHARRLDLVRAACRSPQDAMNDLGAGRIQISVMPPAGALPHVQAGRARILAVTSAIRAPAAPEVATTAEQGFPDYALQGFVGVFGPPDMPQARRDMVSAAVRAVAAEPEIVARLATAGQVARRIIRGRRPPGGRRGRAGSGPAGAGATIRLTREDRSRPAATRALPGINPAAPPFPAAGGPSRRPQGRARRGSTAPAAPRRRRHRAGAWA